MSTPAFLLVEIADEHANQVGLLVELAAAAREAGGTVYAHAPPGRVACLEPGTIASGLLVAHWADRERARRAAHERLLPRLRAALPAACRPLVLLVEALPADGLPSMPAIPTAASVPRPPASPRNTFLVVRGSAWDQQRLDAYRDVILPMHFERGGYYEAFAIAPGQVEALAGEWREGIFAISRWPERRHAEDFWYSDRYQTQAIPLRLGAGRFTVHALEAAQ